MFFNGFSVMPKILELPSVNDTSTASRSWVEFQGVNLIPPSSSCFIPDDCWFTKKNTILNDSLHKL